ncbi:MAG: DUF2851 family protein [Rhodothermales bacterium]
MEGRRYRQESTTENKASVFYGEEDDVFEVALHEPSQTELKRLPEAFLHDVWEAQRFSKVDLSTSDGRHVSIIRPGKKNSDSGADFTGAVLKIDDMDWVGDVEIHVLSSQWYEHRHHQDTRYNSVVLHVCLHADVWTGHLNRSDGTTIPEIVLYPRLLRPVRNLIHDYYSRTNPPILCASHWRNIPQPLLTEWLDELAETRLLRRTHRVKQQSEFDLSLEQDLFERVFAALGYAKNAEPMKELARRLPLSFVRSEIDCDDLEACFLGVAGLVPSPADLLDADRATADYAMMLRERFERLQLRLNLPTMTRETWKFFRLRPANFPPIRIAQGTALVRSGALFDGSPVARLQGACLEDATLRRLRRCFDIDIPSYWHSHVRLEKRASRLSGSIGRQRIDTILVNAVLPVLLKEADRTSNAQLRQAVYSALEKLPPEKDEVVRLYSGLGTVPQSAKQAQGLHELYRSFCQQARCLSCRIGRHHLSASDSEWE